MKKLIFLIPLSFLLSYQNLHAEEKASIYGVGAVNCGKYLKLIENNNYLIAFSIWKSGYFSALNSVRTGLGEPAVNLNDKRLSPDAQDTLIKFICQQSRPDNIFSGVAASVYGHMAKQQGIDVWDVIGVHTK
ncbi:hypothetical protein [Acetobacter fallax]|uniref:Uncharacterized protein n=1 Tax=Acetobacter fallax TaxID=1737473 RepID=A0ABX0KF76_9PROT|nr:hypothetical protein [Acetobacter fallax]NHO32582.1 hypothetical protein [Acetobacter fallax]NHO36073.1 hypothetical protein [Acetobacter fallax]